MIDLPCWIALQDGACRNEKSLGLVITDPQRAYQSVKEQLISGRRFQLFVSRPSHEAQLCVRLSSTESRGRNMFSITSYTPSILSFSLLAQVAGFGVKLLACLPLAPVILLAWACALMEREPAVSDDAKSKSGGDAGPPSEEGIASSAATPDLGPPVIGVL